MAQAPSKRGSEPLVLILDPDAEYSAALAAELEAGGVHVEVASEAEEGLSKAVALQPELVVMGVGQQSTRDRFQLLPRLWEATAAAVIVLNEGSMSRASLEEAAQAGAVTCLSKAQVLPKSAAGFARAQLAALGRTTSRFLRAGAAVLDLPGRTLRVGETKVPLTHKQARIVAMLLEPPIDEWKSIPAIARQVFGEGAKESIVRKHINRLRLKFSQAALGARIETAHAKGYRLVAGGDASDRTASGVRDQ
ncbi:MAG: winged helix-turn-helix domain-containing protein [Acidobacteriota bacterium]